MKFYIANNYIYISMTRASNIVQIS